VKAIFGILLTLLILVTQTGFIYQAHYCGDEKVEERVGIVFSNLSCGMAEAQVQKTCSSSDSSKDLLNKKQCCHNENSYHKLIPETESDHFQFEINEVDINLGLYSLSLKNEIAGNKIPVLLTSKPPPDGWKKRNLSNILTQSKYLAYIQSYLC
jgi:hypothetical protein